MSNAIDPKWAWAEYVPSPDNSWDLKKAGHLYRRATFGASWDELQTAVREGPDRTITALLQGRSYVTPQDIKDGLSTTLAVAEAEYRKVTFHKEVLDQDAHADAVLLGPGHPLYAAVDEKLNEQLEHAGVPFFQSARKFYSALFSGVSR